MFSRTCRASLRRAPRTHTATPVLLSAAKPRAVFATSTSRRQREPKASVTGCGKSKAPAAPTPAVTSVSFWSSKPTWKRAGLNTLRCLIGCTLGDFSAMWYLQAFHPDLGTGAIMGISMATGITTSLLLETVLLRYGKDRLRWMTAMKTAAGMSLISMISMELAENLVDYYLTGGVIQLDSPQFWGAAALSVAAGFLTPLPYNYNRLRMFGKACH